MALRRFLIISLGIHLLVITAVVLVPVQTEEPPGPVIKISFEKPPSPPLILSEETPPSPPPPLAVPKVVIPKPEEPEKDLPPPDLPGEIPPDTGPSDSGTAEEKETGEEDGLRADAPISLKADAPSAGADAPSAGRAAPSAGRVAPSAGADAKGPSIEGLFDKEIIAGIAKKKKKKTAALGFYPQELRHRFYMSRLKDIIEGTWVYPPAALRKGIYGDLVIWFTINKDGTLGDVKLMRTSGHEILDESALKALKNAAPFWPLPDSWGIEGLEIRGSFTYSLYGEFYIR